ncbi:endonuclease/exonuclease/phosphatase family protein [Treponema denticola]|uniref:endonuclease/exonuclease/phosphatase family protein n=1 Tax=Treponema denticola TaxID=158 RepID=UPI00210336AF|nr:endonuclease/exonuclease/phosphatase family protein [Treponema denticola]UTY23132.1 endonuclease/exonuclease/phosphatase family protein [Treponema denticola]
MENSGEINSSIGLVKTQRAQRKNMILVTWNCCCGLTSEKAEKIIKEFPSDIYIIQECRDLDRYNLSNYFKFSNWYGDNTEYDEKTGKGDLGVGIFSNRYCITLQYYHNRNIRYFIPFKVFNNEEYYTIYAVWTKKEKCDFPYIGQVIEGLKEEDYRNISESIVVGDFNTDINYQNEREYFAYMINLFKDKNLKSCYHKFNKIEFGVDKEIKTYKNIGHVDYCFIPEKWKVLSVKTGEHDKWYQNQWKLSKNTIDHIPMQIVFETID